MEIPIDVTSLPYDGPKYLLGTSNEDALVYDDDMNVIGWRFKLPDESIMMVPLVPMPE